MANAEAEALDAAIVAGLSWLKRSQKPEGYWVGRLQSNCCIEAEWVLALHILGLRDHPLRKRLAKAILHEQRPDGSWQVYYGAPAGDVNATVECYAALRSVGMPANSEPLSRARNWILSRNGLSNIRVFTRYWLALIGEWPWEQTPNVPPECIYLPKWFPFSIYNFSSWARATLLPISLMSSERPVVLLNDDERLDELFPNGRAEFDYSLAKKGRLFSWRRFFFLVDRLLHRAQSLGLPPFRGRAKARVRTWIEDHQDADGVWGGIQPPWIYSLMALRLGGYPFDHPVIAKALAALDDPRWRIDEEDRTVIQASTSPIWDTLLSLLAIQDTEPAKMREEAVRAYEWILSQEVRTEGDWKVKVPDASPGGWAFEYENAHYPDIDDTGVALIVLSAIKDHPQWQSEGIGAAVERAVDWMLAMQCSNGGWAAFDKDNDKAILTKIPFCDFGEALDPPSVDVTAHVIEAMGRLGYDKAHPAVHRGLTFIRDQQEVDGSWFGRWGVNFIYGTASVLPALEAIGEDMRAPYITRAADWVLSRQNKDGGWGESCASYMDPEQAGRGESTASQTGWALMALTSLNRPKDRDAVRRGVEFLISRQTDEGSWDEPQFTGTGFPGYGVGLRIKLGDSDLEERLKQGSELSRAFMINYHMYRHYFPLMALGRCRSYLSSRPNIGVVESANAAGRQD